ncbi:MAG: hypothetical protein IJS29_04870 [Selenomonadaceae bacterium]|nr:hypothetical protein [Selenomonadaceae bacterium]
MDFESINSANLELMDSKNFTFEDKLELFNLKKSELYLKLNEIHDRLQTARKNGASKEESLAIVNEGRKISDEIDAITPIIQILEKKRKTQEYEEMRAKRREEEELKRKADEAAKLEKQAREKEFWLNIESKMNNRIANVADKILDILKVQIVPSTECVEMNDKFIKILFNYSEKDFEALIGGKADKIIEKKAGTHKGKKKEAIKSPYKLKNATGYEDTTPLDEFDRAVLGVIASEYLAGNRYTTVNIIFRALIGKVGEVGIYPNKNQKESIIQAVIKLMACIGDFSGFSESFSKMHYTDKKGNELKFRSASLLSAVIVDAKINGQVMDGVIYFKNDLQLFIIADAKSQIIRYNHELLNVPNQNNTPRIIAIKKYVIRRICEIKLHKQLVPTITFNDVFKKARMENSTRDTKRDARNNIIKLFEHLKEQNFITDFEIVQRKNSFSGVKFSY